MKILRTQYHLPPEKRRYDISDIQIEILLHSLQLLKDVINAAGAGNPYSASEILNPEWDFLIVLNEAYQFGIRLDGEDE